MHKKQNVLIVLSWALAGALTVGMLSGCAHHNGVSDKVASSQEPSPTPAALQGHNEDTSSNLGAWGRAMGSVLISMNEGSPYYFGGYAISDANQEAAAKILKKSWGVTSRKKLLKQIKTLLDTGDREEYLKEAKEMDALSEKQLKAAMEQLSGTLLIHYQLVQHNLETWGERGLLAWDMCRISHLVQWGYIAGYLDDIEAQAMIEPAAQELKEQFDHWDDVIMNWLDGYALAATIDMEQEGNDYDARKEIYQSLIDGQAEHGTLYDDTLFDTDIIPISDISYMDLLGELKQKKKSKKKKKKNQESDANQQDTDSEDSQE